jgi:hypothetical protein
MHKLKLLVTTNEPSVPTNGTMTLMSQNFFARLGSNYGGDVKEKKFDAQDEQHELSDLLNVVSDRRHS